MKFELYLGNQEEDKAFNKWGDIPIRFNDQDEVIEFLHMNSAYATPEYIERRLQEAIDKNVQGTFYPVDYGLDFSVGYTVFFTKEAPKFLFNAILTIRKKLMNMSEDEVLAFVNDAYYDMDVDAAGYSTIQELAGLLRDTEKVYPNVPVSAAGQYIVKKDPNS